MHAVRGRLLAVAALVLGVGFFAAGPRPLASAAPSPAKPDFPTKHVATPTAATPTSPARARATAAPAQEACIGPEFCYCGGSARSDGGGNFSVACSNSFCCPVGQPNCSGSRRVSVYCANGSYYGSDTDSQNGCYVWCEDDQGNRNTRYCCS